MRKRIEDNRFSLNTTFSNRIKCWLASQICWNLFDVVSWRNSSINPSLQFSIRPCECNSSWRTGYNVNISLKEIVIDSYFSNTQFHILKWTWYVPFPYWSINDWDISSDDARRLILRWINKGCFLEVEITLSFNFKQGGEDFFLILQSMDLDWYMLKIVRATEKLFEKLSLFHKIYLIVKMIVEIAIGDINLLIYFEEWMNHLDK